MRNFILFFTLVIILLSCAGNDSLPEEEKDNYDVQKLFPTTLNIPSSKPFLEIILDPLPVAKGYIDLIDIDISSNNIGEYSFSIGYRDDNETVANFRYFLYADNKWTRHVGIRQGGSTEEVYDDTDAGLTDQYFKGKEVNINLSDNPRMQSASISTDTCLNIYLDTRYGFNSIKRYGYYKYSGNNKFTRIGIFEIKSDGRQGTEEISFSEGVDCLGNPVENEGMEVDSKDIFLS